MSQAFSNTTISCGSLSFLDLALSKGVLKHFLIHQARNKCVMCGNYSHDPEGRCPAN